MKSQFQLSVDNVFIHLQGYSKTVQKNDEVIGKHEEKENKMSCSSKEKSNPWRKKEQIQEESNVY